MIGSVVRLIGWLDVPKVEYPPSTSRCRSKSAAEISTPAIQNLVVVAIAGTAHRMANHPGSLEVLLSQQFPVGQWVIVGHDQPMELIH